MPLVDLVILAALSEELAAVLDMFNRFAIPHGKTQRNHREDHLFEVKTDSGRERYSVVISSDHAMGGVKMASFATDVLSQWHPHAAVLSGIAASARPDKIGLGSVVVADQVFSYDDIAVSQNDDVPFSFAFRKCGYPVHEGLRRAAGALITHQEEWANECVSIAQEAASLATKPNAVIPPRNLKSPRLLVGTEAAGPFLVRSEVFRNALHHKHAEVASLITSTIDEKVAWLEMEANGFMDACHKKSVPAIVIKGISDLGDSGKSATETSGNGFWRRFAATNAALAIIRILGQHPLGAPSESNRSMIRLQHSEEFASHLGLARFDDSGTFFAFPTAITSHGPVVDLAVELSAVGADRKNMLPTHCQLIYHDSHGHRTISVPHHAGAPYRLKLEDSERPITVSLALRFPKRLSKLTLSLDGPFNSGTGETWTSATKAKKLAATVPSTVWVGAWPSKGAALWTALKPDALLSFRDGRRAERLGGKWEVEWYTDSNYKHRLRWENCETSLLEEYPADQVEVFPSGSGLVACSHTSRERKLPYWFIGRVSDLNVVTLQYWSPSTRNGSNRVGVLCLQIVGFDHNSMVGTWRGTEQSDAPRDARDSSSPEVKFVEGSVRWTRRTT